ncbi:MAG: electron transfer flavoprotein subunit beta/FixA family protein [Deltaproteobacteria bacterium]|nr:electron transfer flavoprotein subunit beta/FixA family protein [Deltaproteobacteria bacterium]
MRVVVCIKQVGYIYDPTAIDLSTGEIDSEKMVSMLNPYDEVAVEEAIKIKERVIDCEVVIITAGQPETERALRYAFAMGGDRMIRINYESSDPWSTALVLASAIEKIGYDLVLCGKKAIDSNNGQVGSFIAEWLRVPQISGIVSMNLSAPEKKAIVERYLGKGDKEELECGLPALFTAETALNDPRYPTLPNRLSAQEAEVEALDTVALGIDSDSEESMTQIMNFSQPRPKTRMVFSPDSSLSASDRLQQMMSGGDTNEPSDILEGSTDRLAGHFVEFLIQEKILGDAEDDK